MAEVSSFKERLLNSCGHDVLVENSERLIKQLQKGIRFLREQWKNKSEVINFLLQPGSSTSTYVLKQTLLLMVTFRF